MEPPSITNGTVRGRAARLACAARSLPVPTMRVPAVTAVLLVPVLSACAPAQLRMPAGFAAA